MRVFFSLALSSLFLITPVTSSDLKSSFTSSRKVGRVPYAYPIELSPLEKLSYGLALQHPTTTFKGVENCRGFLDAVTERTRHLR